MESHIPPAEVRFSSCQTAFSLRVYHVCEGPTPRGVCAQYVKTSPYYTLLYSHKATACRTHRDTQREQWAMDYGKTKQPMRHTPMRRTDTRQTTASTRTRSFLHLNATTHNPPIHPWIMAKPNNPCGTLPCAGRTHDRQQPAHEPVAFSTSTRQPTTLQSTHPAPTARAYLRREHVLRLPATRLTHLLHALNTTTSWCGELELRLL